MKFYYEGQLIRTSTHNYTHAVINTANNSCFGCRTSKEACASLINSEINGYLQAIENEKNIIKAIQNGRKMYTCKEGRRTFSLPVDPKWTEEIVLGFIKNNEDAIQYVRTNYKVVELEARTK